MIDFLLCGFFLLPPFFSFFLGGGFNPFRSTSAHPKAHPAVLVKALLVLEACSKNCGRRFHLQIADRSFMDQMAKLVVGKSALGRLASTDKTDSPLPPLTPPSHSRPQLQAGRQAGTHPHTHTHTHTHDRTPRTIYNVWVCQFLKWWSPYAPKYSVPL